VTKAVAHAPHTGHLLRRGKLQYRREEKWHTVDEGSRSNLEWIMSHDDTDACSNRWRIADWRCDSNQWLMGIDLAVTECGDCSGCLTANGGEKQYVDFRYSSDQPSGWNYKRLKEESEDFLTENEIGQNCQSWGYIGGDEDAYRLTERDIYLQASDKYETQHVEFHFCSQVSVTKAVAHAPHTGHLLRRGKLQYRREEKWHTVDEGSRSNLEWIMSHDDTDACSNRWRIADWRCDSNQWLKGIDLSVTECGKC